MYCYVKTEIAAAYDQLSILEIKKRKTINPDKKFDLNNQIEVLQININEAIGYDLARKIHDSVAYACLWSANWAIFELIDECHTRNPGITLKEADKLNFYRYEAKVKLQKEFFNKEIEEIKLGYS